jgi:hypothetical protein
MEEHKLAAGFLQHICRKVEFAFWSKIMYYTKCWIYPASEACAIRITIDKVELCIMCLYRAPDGDLNLLHS